MGGSGRGKVRRAPFLLFGHSEPMWRQNWVGKTREGGLDKEGEERQERGQRDLLPGAQHFR